MVNNVRFKLYFVIYQIYSYICGLSIVIVLIKAFAQSSLRIVDIPGDERLRSKYFDKYKSSVKGLVYMIDSMTIQKEIRDVAE